MTTKLAFAYLSFACSLAFGSAYRIEEIVIPGAIGVEPESINDSGVVVGSYYTQTGSFGFTFQNGIVQQIGSSQTGWLRPFDINNNGDIVGQASLSAFILNGVSSQLSLYSMPDCLFTTFWGNNDAGSVVGQCFNPAAATTGFLFTNGTFDTAVSPVSQMGPVTDINNKNQILSFFGYGQLGWNVVLPLGGYGVNDLGQIAMGTGIWTGGVFNPIPVPGDMQVALHKLNNSGQVVGTFYDGTTMHGFIATPTPEPATLFGTVTLFAIVGLRRSPRNPIKRE